MGNREGGSTGSLGSAGSTGVEGAHNSYSVPILHIYNFAALLIFMRRTTISHFSFLISHSSEAFIRNQGMASHTG